MAPRNLSEPVGLPPGDVPGVSGAGFAARSTVGDTATGIGRGAPVDPAAGAWGDPLRRLAARWAQLAPVRDPRMVPRLAGVLAEPETK